jgi:hypothetical protein
MNDVSVAVARWLDDMFGGRLPNDPCEGTAFAAAVTWELAPKKARFPLLYCLPHSKRTRQLLDEHGIQFALVERMVDFLVVEQKSQTKHTPLIACESEMNDQGVSYSFDVGPSGPTEGYVWDFWKLLHFNAPHLLFIARVPSAESCIPMLEITLNQCAGEYHDELWKGRQLSVVLLPTATRKPQPIRLGAGQPNGEIAFHDFEPPAAKATAS